MRRTVLAFAILLSACAHVAQQRVSVEGVVDRLYCGRSIPGGGAVTQADVEAFLDEVVAARFPEGFTVYEAKGHWRTEDEPSFVIEIVHPYGADFDRKVLEIAAEYRLRFRQTSVLRVLTPARMEFVE